MKKIEITLSEKDFPTAQINAEFGDWKPVKGSVFCVAERSLKAETIAKRIEAAQSAGLPTVNIDKDRIVQLMVEGSTQTHAVMLSRWRAELEKSSLPLTIKNGTGKAQTEVINFNVFGQFEGNKISLKAL